jgi:cation diffusion facilitator CzcD-associated flavoprotein CzcO
LAEAYSIPEGRKKCDITTLKSHILSKLANWLESYAEALELNVWTSSTVTQAVQDPSSEHWKVTVKRNNGTERVFIVEHLIFATGAQGIGFKMPNIPGVVSVSRAACTRSQ